MKTKTSTLISLAMGVAMASGSAFAADQAMEKCSVVKDGKGLIKANKADCKTSGHSCAGQNPSGEIDAFIVVPAGECIKINQGDFSGVDASIKEKIEIIE